MGEKSSDNSSRKKKPGLIKELMSGRVLSEKIILGNLTYIVFLTFLASLYIGNRFHAESLNRRSTKLGNEVRELRANALSVSAELGDQSKQSEVINLVKKRGLGLEELTEAPYFIVVR